MPTQNISWVDIARDFDNHRRPNDYRRRWMRLCSNGGSLLQISSPNAENGEQIPDSFDNSLMELEFQSTTMKHDKAKDVMTDRQLLDYLSSLNAEDESEVVFASIDRVFRSASCNYASKFQIYRLINIYTRTSQYVDKRWNALKKSCPNHIRGYSNILAYLIQQEDLLSSSNPTDGHDIHEPDGIILNEDSSVEDDELATRNRVSVDQIFHAHNGNKMLEIRDEQPKEILMANDSRTNSRMNATENEFEQLDSMDYDVEDDDNDRKRRKLEKKEKKRLKKERKRSHEEKKLRKESRRQEREEDLR